MRNREPIPTKMSRACWSFCHNRAKCRKSPGWYRWWRQASELAPLLHNLVMALLFPKYREAL